MAAAPSAGATRIDRLRAANGEQPGLGRLTELLDGSRRAGVQIEAELTTGSTPCAPGRRWPPTGSSRRRWPTPPGTGPARSGCRCTMTPRPSRWHVDNAAAHPSGQPGHGITGMQERARAEGGELRVAHDDGWFTVDATLPIGERR